MMTIPIMIRIVMMAWMHNQRRRQEEIISQSIAITRYYHIVIALKFHSFTVIRHHILSSRFPSLVILVGE